MCYSSILLLVSNKLQDVLQNFHILAGVALLFVGQLQTIENQHEDVMRKLQFRSKLDNVCCKKLCVYY